MSLFNIKEVIQKKRMNIPLTTEEIQTMISQYMDNKITDSQMAAWLMAVVLNGLNTHETFVLTETMLHSGEKISFPSHIHPIVDKHSTGGVGDKTSLLVGPILAACGINVAMLAGRGLGHTGGTVDKLESIPGFDTSKSPSSMYDIIKKSGVFYGCQTEKLAPADRKMYELRNHTATVESIPLIVASIMSKKLAIDTKAIVLDVKWGNGAFMKTTENAEALGKLLVYVAKRYGRNTRAIITDMNQPLGYYIGNLLEVQECVNILEGKEVPDLVTVSCTLTGHILHMLKKVETVEEGIEKSKETLINGKAMDHWHSTVHCHNGEINSLNKKLTKWKNIPHQHIYTHKEGFLNNFNTYKIGMAVCHIATSSSSSSQGDDMAGIILRKKRGEYVKKGDNIMTIYAQNTHHIEDVYATIKDSFDIGITKTPLPPYILKNIL